MINKLRKTIFWLNLVVGVVAELFILSMVVSGLSIAYERQITAWAEHAQRTVTVPAGVPRLGVEALAATSPDTRP